MSAAAAGVGRIVVVGSLNADLTIYCDRLPQPGETVQGHGFAVNPGGKSANQAVAAARLGGHVSLVGAVGEDPNGAMLEASVAGAGVDVGHVRTSGEPTGVAVIAVDARGENNIIVSAGANGTLSPKDVAEAADVMEGAAVVSLCLEVSMDTVLAAAQAGHDVGATVLLNLSPYAEIPSALAGLADILLVNAHEAALFLGSSVPGAGAAASEWDEVRSRFSERGIQQVLVTLGSQGSVVLDSLASAGSRVAFVQPMQVQAVDTTGAGDAFTGAVAVRLAAGDALADAAAFASVAAALATTRKGTQAAYPEAADVERRLRTP
ncbi:ribokinase [Arthrobacter sp. FW306-05-C]|uniref:ribokinase n=1 Tax=Arthrobacter sp. FW306-05-C TaxID=2879620 RepID=UPI001F1D1BDB|nr:ribokinase [Arthrobacter sp. FW306-05-C]UKA66980.1 ribokinase [Arthrobacter sp. FW306-05-C]